MKLKSIKFKRLLMFILACVLMLSMTSPAFADEFEDATVDDPVTVIEELDPVDDDPIAEDESAVDDVVVKEVVAAEEVVEEVAQEITPIPALDFLAPLPFVALSLVIPEATFADIAPTAAAALPDYTQIHDVDLGFHHGTSPNGGQSVTKNLLPNGYVKKQTEWFVQIGQNMWLLVTKVGGTDENPEFAENTDYICPICGSSTWISYSNNSDILGGKFDGKNMQVAHIAGGYTDPYGTVSFKKMVKMGNDAPRIASPLDGFSFNLYKCIDRNGAIDGAAIATNIEPDFGGVVSFNFAAGQGFIVGWYKFVENNTPGFMLEDPAMRANGIIFELRLIGGELVPYWPDGTPVDADGNDEINNIPTLGNLAVTVDVKQQNYKQDWREIQAQDWREIQKQDWREIKAQDWREIQAQDWREIQKQDWREIQAQDWREIQAQDWREIQAQDWREIQAQDWREIQAQDWREIKAQDWREIQKQDWREIIQPVFEKKTAKGANGSVVTIIEMKGKTAANAAGSLGYAWNNNHTFVNLSIADLLAGPKTYQMCIANGAQTPVVAPPLANLTYTVSLSDPVAIQVPLLDSKGKEIKEKGVVQMTTVNGYYLIITLDDRIVSGNFGADVWLNDYAATTKLNNPASPKGANYAGGQTFYAKAAANGGGKDPVVVKATDTAYLYFKADNGSNITFFTTGNYEFVTWRATGKEDVGDPYKSGEENVGTPYKTGEENVGDPRKTGEENVGDPRKTGEENVGDPRKTGEEDVNAPYKIDEENVDAPYYIGEEYVGTPYKTGEEDVNAPYKIDEEDVNAPYYIGEEYVGTPYKTGEENVNAPYKTGEENVGAPYNDGAPVAYTGALTLTITGPGGYNSVIPVTGGSYANTFTGLAAGNYTVTLSGAGFTTESKPVNVPAGGTGTASFSKVVAGTTSVGTKLAPRIVVGDKQAPRIVVGDQKAPRIVQGDKLAPRIVVGDKLTPRIVVGDQKAPRIVQGDKLAPRIVVGDQKDPRIVEGDKLAPRIVQGDKLAPRIVVGDKLAPRIVEGDKLAPRIIVGDKLAARKMCEDCNETDAFHPHAIRLN